MPAQNFSIETSSLWKDINEVLKKASTDNTFNLTAVIHTELEDYAVMIVRNLDIIRDYEHQIADQTTLEFNLAFGDYVFRFYPFIHNMELTLSIQYHQSDPLVAKLIKKQRYKLVFLPNENLHVNLSEYQSIDKNTLDNLKIVTVKVQLLNRVLEPFRIKMTSGIYRQCKPFTVLHNVTTSQAQLILVDGKPALDAVDIYPPDNNEIQSHIVIPNNTLVCQLPTYLQEKMNGVYSAGIGSYLQYYNNKNTWFVYPLFNYDRYKTDQTQSNKAIFYFVPGYRYGGIENTYYLDGKLLKILCTGEKGYRDDGDTQYMDQGVGVAQSDARSFMAKPAVITETGPKGNPARTNTLVANQYRDDGLMYAPNSSTPISSNPFQTFSEVARRRLSYISVEWQHSDDSLIYPGMPCEFVYLEDGKRKSVNGIVAQIQTFVNKANKGMVTNLFVRKSYLVIYSDRVTQTKVAPKAQAVGTPLVGRS
jgi:hypothetical protein